jgi:hypothetical protein
MDWLRSNQDLHSEKLATNYLATAQPLNMSVNVLFSSVLPNSIALKVPRLCPLHLPSRGVLRWRKTWIIGFQQNYI